MDGSEHWAEELVGEVRRLREVVEGQRSDRPLTRIEAAEYLGVHPDTLYRWAVEGRLAYSRLGDGTKAPLRFSREDLDDFIARNRIATTEETKARL